MESQIDQILGFLKHQREDVKKQALDAFLQLSGNTEYSSSLRREDVVRSVTACLYEHKFVHKALLTLVNMSSDSQIVAIMVKTRILSTLLQIIFNIMKISRSLDTKKEAEILVESKLVKEKEGEMDKDVKELKVNTNETIDSEDAVATLNKENLKLCLYVISNMCGLDKKARDQFLEGKDGEKFQGNHFLVLLGWYSMDKYELMFEPFSAILNSLTQEEEIREFLLTQEVRLEERLKKFIIHENNSIRLATHQTFKHLMFSHDNEYLAKRFCTIREDEAHILELNTRSLFMVMNKAFDLDEDHKEFLEEKLGQFWNPIKTKKKKENNMMVKPAIEELEIILEFLLVSTNVDFDQFYRVDGPKLEETEVVKNMNLLLNILKGYVEPNLRDKINAIRSLYTGKVFMSQTTTRTHIYPKPKLTKTILISQTKKKPKEIISNFHQKKFSQHNLKKSVQEIIKIYVG